MGRRLLSGLVALLALAGIGWASAALWIDGPGPWAALVLPATGVASLLALSRLRALAVCALLFVIVLVWWLAIAPRQDRNWLPEVARLPEATIEGDRITIRNVRNFHYRSREDWDARWEERVYDLSELRGVDMFLSYWGSPWIAHTIASWQFGDGEHLAISIETRKERGEGYSALLGFFRQFELYYVVADERDVVRLRTDHRGEQVYLYRLNARPEVARAVLLDYLREINALAEAPQWYNAATHNCTTTIRHHVQHVAPGNPWDWRLLVNGQLDRLGYERGDIDTSLPFETLRARSEISARARAAQGADDFSRRIRAGLPGFSRENHE